MWRSWNSIVRQGQCAELLPDRLALGCLLAAVMLMAGCGGGGGGGGSSSPSPTIRLSGIATFARVPATSTGLNYSGTVARPIRGAVIQVRNAAGTSVLYQSSTDSSGNWSIQAPQSSSVLVVVLAALGTPSAITTQIVDQTSSDALYTVYLAKTTTTVDEAGLTINANSGWTGASYGSNRTSGPFAILDTAYSAQQLILSVDPSATFPLLQINWSINNSTALISTSHFDPNTGRVSILGKENEDTDEFDALVVAHEWGHWFESRFSRSDSLGGSHGGGDILDETVAFGEGWGNAFSGMVNRDPNYIDTVGAQQATVGVAINLESNSSSSSATVGGGDPRRIDGGWSERSVQEILWDVFDGTGGTTDLDGDGVALGFTPMYQVFIGQQRTFIGFTSIYSFMFYLKSANASASTALTTLETNESIGAHDAYHQTAAGVARYTQVPSNGTVLTVDLDGDPLTTYDTYGEITGSSDGNKLYNRLLFYGVAPSTGTFRIRASPVNGTHDLAIRRPTLASPSAIDSVFGGSEFVDVTANSGAVIVFSVSSFATGTNPSGVTPFVLQFGTPAVVGKPSPTDVAPPIPAANG